MKYLTCSTCREELPETNFHVNKSNKYGRNNECKTCRSLRAKSTYDYTVERGRHLKRKYGISLEEYSTLLEKQEGVCALCRKGPEGSRYEILVVDHDHETNEIRGLLCQQCNMALGRLGDNVESIERVLAYLRKE